MDTTKLKKSIFSVLLFLIPVLFFILFEIVLRLFHYGAEYDLVHVVKFGNKKYYQVNKQVAKRYFSSQDVTIPDARDGIFQYEKAQNTIRIFCLGGSTTAGFPYQYNATFPSLLNDRLESLFPQKKFEIINFGISAINSYSVLDFSRELIKYQPDLVLIYMGHNEFYGALGVASTQAIGTNRNFINVYLKLEKFKTFQLVRNFIYKFKAHKSKSDKNQVTLMQSVVADKVIPTNSKKYKIAHENFKENLRDIISTFADYKIPVFVSTLVCNLKDQYPFVSVFNQDFEKQDEWNRLFETGLALKKDGEFEQAVAEFLQAKSLNDNPAKLYYELAECYEQLEDFNSASNTYLIAKNNDALRFRASSEINKIIKDICSSLNVPCVDIETIFADQSPHKLVGNNLMLEHLHPNFKGNYYIAEGFLKTIALSNLFVESELWPWENDGSLDQNLQNAYVTDMDIEIAHLRIKRLTSQWPFVKPKDFESPYMADYAEVLNQVVDKVTKSELSWNEGHYKIAEFLAGVGEYEKAEREYRAVIKVIPNNYYAFLYLGNMLLSQKKFKDAETTFQKCLLLNPNSPYGFAKLGMLYLGNGEPQYAHEYLEKSIEVDEKTHIFPDNEIGRAHYLNALALAQLNKFAQARSEAFIALEFLPGNKDLEKLISQIPSQNVHKK